VVYAGEGGQEGDQLAQGRAVLQAMEEQEAGGAAQQGGRVQARTGGGDGRPAAGATGVQAPPS
jgi:hypothetical protein